MRDNTSVEHSTVRKMAWRLMPLFTVGYFLASSTASTSALRHYK